MASVDSIDVDQGDILESDASNENYFYKGDNYHSRSDVCVHSNASTLPVPLPEEDELVDPED